MDADDLILVAGATGNTGSALLQELEARGARVRAMVRSQKDELRLTGAVAGTVVANFDDPASLASALNGVTRAYLITPSSPDAEAQQRRFAEHAAAAGVTHLVKLSQFAANEASPVRFLRYHAAVERRIRELGVGFTFLRPNLYFQGLLAFQSMIATQGHFVAPVGEARVSAVDVRDIAAVAACALTESGHEGKTYTITGPAAVTHSEMADAIGKAIGRPVAFMDVPSDAFAGALKAAGVPAWQVDGLVEDYAHYARGEAATISPHVREVTGRDPRGLGEFARDYAQAFLAA
ncbi:MAG TPA: SDR family oxidoreductase [Vicinamibacterales bacterium]|nr:SDR family oxidoreductase [Vicinamibacterales bacterium]